jgi:hypothetical protein
LPGNFQNPLSVALRVGTGLAGNDFVGFLFHPIFSETGGTLR